jgi:hypothetical protein
MDVAYRKANSQERREYNTRYYQVNREALQEQMAHYRRLNGNEHFKKRDATIRGANQVELVDRLAVFERDKGICQICHWPVEYDDYHLDHIIPLSKGGSHTYNNVQVTHGHCNLEKGDRYGHTSS